MRWIPFCLQLFDEMAEEHHHRVSIHFCSKGVFSLRPRMERSVEIVHLDTHLERRLKMYSKLPMSESDVEGIHRDNTWSKKQGVKRQIPWASATRTLPFNLSTYDHVCSNKAGLEFFGHCWQRYKSVLQSNEKRKYSNVRLSVKGFREKFYRLGEWSLHDLSKIKTTPLPAFVPAGEFHLELVRIRCAPNCAFRVFC